MNREEWREPTSEEIRLIRHMLSIHFPGSGEYNAQLIGLKVARDTEDGLTLYLLPNERAPRAKTSDSGVLTVGAYGDSDGIKVEILLVARAGALRFLDWMKLDPLKEALIMFPPNDAISVRTSPPPITLRESPN